MHYVEKDYLQMEVDSNDVDSSTNGSSIYIEAYRSKQSSYASLDTTFEGRYWTLCVTCGTPPQFMIDLAYSLAQNKRVE